ncbi:zinc finger protein squeeze-like isoform X2 [Ruditapes philippinarum]|uniref:zinc finger protein squeeze-like isoform X2 n=1 Tax=Ruditapes philippinarum TaxID=129788 RepID=UPI00295B3EB0|nr:zinc finger protein squeeze-like isoform X2 [Ruditapes philippinarum]
MATNDQPNYPPSSSYSQPQSSSSVFYENEVKKGSEIMLRDSEVQQLLQQSREVQHSQQQQQHLQQMQQQQQHHLQQQQHQQQQELLQLPVKSEPMPHSPEKMAPVTSSTSEASPKQSGSPVTLNDDRSRLSQSDRTHLCMTCFKGFRNKPQLTQHELVHNNKRKHVCSYCEKSFKQICHLNQHIRVHTGDRPYKCDVEGCGRSFAQLSNLNHHKKNHDDTVKRDVSRQFRCHVCERSYATKSSLNTHVQKLHSNLNLDITSPIQSTVTQVPRKRKKKGENRGLQSFDKDPNTYMMDCDSDDGLPTQVKVKSRFETKSNLTVRTGTPPGNGEQDKNRQAPRTTLPLPFTTNHNQSSPLSLRYQQSQVKAKA